MNLFFITFWTVMTFLSIGWYTLLIFIIGIKAGREIRQMIHALGERGDQEKKN